MRKLINQGSRNPYLLKHGVYHLLPAAALGDGDDHHLLGGHKPALSQLHKYLCQLCHIASDITKGTASNLSLPIHCFIKYKKQISNEIR
jgi:hypothetical protein